MLRANLSTRPFYNERAVHAAAALIALAVLALTAWQVVRVVRLSRYKTELNAAIKRDRNEAQKDSIEAQQIRRGIDQKQLAAIAGAAREANDLIAQRTFSWTKLFNHIEQTLPDDVMLTGVRPEIAEGLTQIHMDVQGKDEDVINDFWDRLEKTGKFHNPEWTNVTISPDGNHQMTMQVAYTPAQAAARPAGVKQ